MAENHVKVFDAAIREHSVAIFMTPAGEFTAALDESVYSSPTWEALRAKLMDATRRAKVSAEVEFTDIQGRHGVITGVHAGTHKLLVRWSGGVRKPTQEDSNADWMRRLTEEETQDLLRLQKAKTAAYHALNQFFKERKINPRAAIEQAIREAVAELAAKEDKKSDDNKTDAPGGPRDK